MAEHPNDRPDAEPHWWRPHHSSAWERAKRAFRRDWEQTMADVRGRRGHARPAPTPPEVTHSWEEVEPAVRFGYGSRLNYADEYDSWDEGLEAKLRSEWEEMRTGRLWEEAREFVREGWGGYSDEEKSSEPPVAEQDQHTLH